MSGHSKWSNIKRKKGIEDVKKAKLFTKLAKDIVISARIGGSDVSSNSNLKAAVQKAKEYNLPKDNIKRAIAKGAGNTNGANMEEATYEGYGPNGVAIMVKVLTDNKNRTVSEIRSIFNRSDGSLGEVGCVAYIFTRNPPVAKFTIPLDKTARLLFMNLIDTLEQCEDVIEVIHNAGI